MTSPDHGAALDYDRAKRLAQSAELADRQRVAGSGEVPPELLFFLATDKTSDVRRAISRNPRTPRQADLLLVGDQDVEVRSGLARKIARIAPDLPRERLDQIETMTIGILETLARDKATEVREILSQELNGVATAPATIINILARDLELRVCGPILRNSPILSEDDLVEIVFGGPPAGALSAIAGRSRVTAPVSEAIVASEDVDAVSTLLRNPSAQIREKTLDRIIERAPQNHPWHEPLVNRPHLPERAAARLACFVADSLLQALRTRTDLGPLAARQITDSVRQRLNARPPERIPVGSEPTDPPWADAVAEAEDGPSESAVDRVKRLKRVGKLDEAVVTEALSDGNRAFSVAALAELAGTNIQTVDRVLASQSARPVTALVWRAGLSIRLARQVQARLARIPPNKIIGKSDGSGFPLSDKDMIWQLEFFGIV